MVTIPLLLVISMLTLIMVVHWLVCSLILLWNTIFVVIDVSYCESVKFTYERDMVLLTPGLTL